MEHAGSAPPRQITGQGEPPGLLEVHRVDALSFPTDVAQWLEQLEARPRLVVHLQLVHEVAVQLVKQLQRSWPQLVLNREQLCFGAASHDIGKCLFPQELTGPGKLHEEAGYQLLRERGVECEWARFARTHGAPTGLNLEDLLVAVADRVWRGRRDDSLEQEVVQRISQAISHDPWQVFAKLDDILTALAAQADRRLHRQSLTRP